MLKRADEPTSHGTVCAIVAIACCLFGIGSAMAAGFAVKPLRIHLYQGHMTESIEVSNDEAVALSMQLRAYAWSQDGEGLDIYEATDELIFFPKLLVLNPGEKRMVRVGVRGAPPESEKAYRIYLEERPDSRIVPQGRLRTLLRVGIPVFRQPAELDHSAEVIDVEIDDCEARFRFANRGNTYMMLKNVAVRALNGAGDELAAGQLRGWYVLTGRERPFVYTIPEEACKATERFEVRIESGPGSFEGVADNRS